MGSAFMSLTHIVRLAQTHLAFTSTSPTIFFLCHVVTASLFLQLAREWPQLAMTWWDADSTIPPHNSRLRTRFTVITTCLLVPSIVEHVLARSFGVVRAYRCSPEGLTWLRLYLVNEYAPTYQYVGFSYWASAALATVNTAATFSWNYMDLFLIIVSQALADRFDRFNSELASIFDKAAPERVWRQLREDFGHLARLAQQTDARLNKLMLLSFTTNLYFICYQLLNSLSPQPSLLELVYRCWSFCYLLGRTCAVSLSAASVHEKSREPKRMLFLVHPSSYGPEVQRLLTQVISDDIALTGFNFFSITRTFMLTVAGTIVTYEIVLVQFNSMSATQAHPAGNMTECMFELE